MPQRALGEASHLLESLMLTLFWIVFWAGLTGLAFLAGLSLRTRLPGGLVRRSPVIDDDAINQILTMGELTVDDPLDLDEIEEEEERFWSESWDEPEEW